MTMPGRSRTARGTTWGGFAFAAFLVAAASGIALAVPFDAQKPYDSITWLLLTNPAARYYRNIHFLAAQLFLVLTVAHVWEHLARGTERRLSPGMWARVTLSLPVAVFLMLSGFVLRGDAEGSQALRIVTTAVSQIPAAGRMLSVLLFGASPGNLQLVYVHHVATATILTWLFTAEHARRIWPNATPVVAVSIGVAAAGLFLSPALHDGLDPLVKGPWYLVGLQELLHWISTPLPIIAAIALALIAVLMLPRGSDDRARRLKRTLAVCLIGYAVVTAFALLFRGENWTLAWPVRAVASGISIESPLAAPSVEIVRTKPIPTVLGRREGCLFCHNGVRGMSAAHRPDAVGCSSCHGGDPFTLDKTLAHRRLILIPGNLDVAARTCGLPQCHAGIVDRVQQSVMTTMAGVVSVDRAVFGEDVSGQVAHGGVRALGTSPADSHLRQLCASCHLANTKTEFGAIGEQSRGGGCNACHVKYTPDARSALARYERERQPGGRHTAASIHPDLSIDIADDHCFGCHSRSGRISTSYEGWMEAEPSGRVGQVGKQRTLADGRVFEYVAPDVHYEKGMRCVDCHTAREAMGDGVAYGRKKDQLRVACEDCHAPGRPAIASGEAVDPEARRILALRGRTPADVRMLATAKGAEPLVNTTVGNDGQMRLNVKGSAAILPLRRPAPVCVKGGGHARLSCVSCHTAWSPRCSGCHTRYDPRGTAYDHVARTDVKGEWIEEGSDYRALPPTLGVRTIRTADGRTSETVDTFAPGMVLTIDRNRAAEQLGVVRPSTSSGRTDVTFRRLYARVAPHTIARGSRTCESCHTDPVALGYGRGVLKFERTATGARWIFSPEHAPSPYDRLPADAWIGFLQTRTAGVSTRDDVRPFSVDEQKRILTVGACLTCHRGDSAVMRDAIADFTTARRRALPSCVIPAY